jgi:hypothetical protein
MKRLSMKADMEWVIPKVVEPSNLTVVSSIWPGIGTGAKMYNCAYNQEFARTNLFTTQAPSPSHG